MEANHSSNTCDVNAHYQKEVTMSKRTAGMWLTRGQQVIAPECHNVAVAFCGEAMTVSQGGSYNVGEKESLANARYIAEPPKREAALLHMILTIIPYIDDDKSLDEIHKNLRDMGYEL